MGPTRTISQQAFDEMVKENIEDLVLDLDPDEALQDAIQALTLQGVDLSGVVTSAGGVEESPLMKCLEKLGGLGDSVTDDELVEVFKKLSAFCGDEDGSGNAALVVKNGGLELVCTLCAKLIDGSGRVVLPRLWWTHFMKGLLHSV